MGVFQLIVLWYLTQLMFVGWSLTFLRSVLSRPAGSQNYIQGDVYCQSVECYDVECLNKSTAVHLGNRNIVNVNLNI
jgi:hypothetical protein